MKGQTTCQTGSGREKRVSKTQTQRGLSKRVQKKEQGERNKRAGRVIRNSADCPPGYDEKNNKRNKTRRERHKRAKGGVGGGLKTHNAIPGRGLEKEVTKKLLIRGHVP